MTIGEVVERLSSAYPDLTISKIRFLEEEGLVSPERTPGGYRKFGPTDVSRVELILRLQREHFLPLAVIREKLAELDRGRVPSELETAVATSAQAATLPFEEAETVPVSSAPAVLGLPVTFVHELTDFGLVAPVAGDDGPELTRSDVAIAHTCWDLRRFGVEPRHLRMYDTFAEREAALFSQILMPAFRHRTPETRQKLIGTLEDLTRLAEDLKRRLLKRSLGKVFEDVV